MDETASEAPRDRTLGPDLRLADPEAPGAIVAKNGEVLPAYKHPGGPFRPGNPWAYGENRKPVGRPPGRRDKIQADFVEALTADFEAHGMSAIVAMRTRKPADYCKVIASLMPKQLEIKDEPFGSVSDAELTAIIAAARGSLVAAQGSRDGNPEEDGEQPPPGLPALS